MKFTKYEIEMMQSITGIHKILVKNYTKIFLKELCRLSEELTLEVIRSDIKKKKWDDQRTSVIQNYVKRVVKNGMKIEKLVKILKKELALSEIISLQDPDLTKEFLLLSDYVVEANCGKELMKSFDLLHVDVLFHYGPSIAHVISDCLSYILSQIFYYHASELGRNFLKGLFSLKIISEENLWIIEDTLMTAKIDSIEIFLQYAFHKVVKARCNRDILTSLYGNPDPNVLVLLRSEGINVDGRACLNNDSPLHYAAGKGIVMHIQFLLDEDANPDALNDQEIDPLFVSLCHMTFAVNHFPREYYGQEEKCFELLLQANSNILAKISRTRRMCFECITVYKNDLKLYCMATIKLLVALIAIYKVLDMSVEEGVLKFLQAMKNWGDGDLLILYEQCISQLKQMSKDEISKLCSNELKTNYSMLTILTENPRRIACYISKENHQTIRSFMEKYSENNLNSFYYRTLQQRIKTILRTSTFA